MSVRGIEIHNGYLDLPEGMPQTLHMGTEASPLTQGEASQIVLSAVVNALALGGTIVAGLFEVIGSVNLTGHLRGLRAITVVNAGIVVTGDASALKVEQEVHAAGQVTAVMDGIRIEQYIPTGGLSFTVHGIFISNFIQTQPSANYYFTRFSENGGVDVEGVLYCSIGGGGTIENLFVLAYTHNAWAGTGDKSGQPNAGWIKVKVAGVERYIQLYGTT